jgi:L-fuconolactonase
VIVDAHHHLIDPDRFRYHFLDHLPDLRRPWLPDDLEPLLAAAGVDATVVEQAHDSEAETAFMLEVTAGVPWVAGVVGWVPLADPDAAGAAIERRRRSCMVGVRHLLQDEPDPDWVVRPEVLASLALLAADGLVFDVSAFGPAHIRHVATIAEAVPELSLVLCHFGFPRVGGGGPPDPAWLDAFRAAAAVPSCSLKVSGLDMTNGFRCEADVFRPYADLALEHFGPDRMIWASNWPVSLYGRGYREALDVWVDLLAELDPAAREQVFGGTAVRVYGLGAGEPAVSAG